MLFSPRHLQATSRVSDVEWAIHFTLTLVGSSYFDTVCITHSGLAQSRYSCRYLIDQAVQQNLLLQNKQGFEKNTTNKGINESCKSCVQLFSPSSSLRM